MQRKFIALFLIILAISALSSGMAQAETAVVIFSKNTALVDDLRYQVSDTEPVRHDIFDLNDAGDTYNLYINSSPTPAQTLVVDQNKHIGFTTAGGGSFHVCKGDPTHDISITSPPQGSPNPVRSGGSVNCSVTAVDTFGHTLEYEWHASAGSFSNPALRNPVWYAPTNTSGSTRQYEISVIVSCSEGLWTGGSYYQNVLTNQAPVADAGSNRTVSSSTLVTLDGCDSYDPDSGPSPLTYEWRQTGGTNTATLSGSSTCSPTFTSPASDDALTFTLTVRDGAAAASDTVTITVDAPTPDVVTITTPPAGNPNPVASGGNAQCSVTAQDSLGHTLSYEWSASGGSFNNRYLRNPVWHAPTNTSGSTQSYQIGVVVRCSAGQSATRSYTQQVTSTTNVPPVADAGEDQLVRGPIP
mgnify:CR=1 FL=1